MARFDNTVHYIEQQIPARLRRRLPSIAPFKSSLYHFEITEDKEETIVLYFDIVSSESEDKKHPPLRMYFHFTFNKKRKLPKNTRFPKWFKDAVYSVADEFEKLYGKYIGVSFDD